MTEPKRSIIAGIDLGTTFSAIAYLDEHGKPVIIPNSDDERITPSVVMFDEQEVIVGKLAKANAISDPERVVQFIKREMGNCDWEKTFFDKKYTPQSISALILKRIVSDASKAIGQEIKDVVITVPAHFNDVERKATQDAGEIAGLNVVGIINEPTAAAISFGMSHRDKPPQKVLVYDLGGGTLDVTILSIDGDNIQVLATDGEVQLGGKDWDDEIINYVAALFKEEYGIDPRVDLDAYQALRDASEMAKITLSKKPKTKIVCQCQGHTLKVDLEKEKFEELTASLLAQTEAFLPIVLEKAQLTWGDIDTVLLSGGSTRMPQVKEMLRRVTGKEPDDSINPDECVALGASLYGAILKVQGKLGEVPGEGEFLPEDVKETLSGLSVRNVASYSLGVVAKDKGVPKNCVIIPAQTLIPCEKSEVFGTEAHNQTRVDVKILEGESEVPEECIQIGTCVISNIPPRPAGAPIRVTFRYNEDGRIEVSAKDEQTGKEAKTEIVRASGLTKKDVEKEKKDIQKFDIS